MYRSFLRVQNAFKNFLSLSCLLYVFTEEIKVLYLCWLYNRTKTRISNQHGQYEYKTHLSISGTVLAMDIICRCYTCMFFFTDHGTWFYIDCNICSCYAGEITCRKKQCEVTSLGVLDSAYTSLPCNCLPHHVPVCGRNGNTYPSSCLAR